MRDEPSDTIAAALLTHYPLGVRSTSSSYRASDEFRRRMLDRARMDRDKRLRNFLLKALQEVTASKCEDRSHLDAADCFELATTIELSEGSDAILHLYVSSIGRYWCFLVDKFDEQLGAFVRIEANEVIRRLVTNLDQLLVKRRYASVQAYIGCLVEGIFLEYADDYPRPLFSYLFDEMLNVDLLSPGCPELESEAFRLG